MYMYYETLTKIFIWYCVAVLFAKTKHRISFSKTETSAHISTYCPYTIREATEVPKHPDIFNCDRGYRLSKVMLHHFPLQPF